MCSGTTWDLHLWVGRDLLGIGGHRDLLLWGQHVLVRESRGHLLVGVGGQVGLRCRRCWLRGWGYVWVYSLRWSRHGAGHHLRVLLGYVAPWRLVALGDLRRGMVAVLMWLHLTRERLLVMRRDTRLRGHVSMRVGLLRREMRARKRPWSRLVPLRQRLRVRLLLLLWLGGRRLGRGLNGHPWSGHELRVGPHLWRYSVAG